MLMIPLYWESHTRLVNYNAHCLPVQQPSSSHTFRQRKKARISQASEADDGVSSESETGEDSDRHNTPPQTQYELMRDAGFKHLENPDFDDHEATQKLRRRAARGFDNMVAESGIIESITCYNFMCHTRLHVELGPLINFIVGENGSGKSAVLTALTLCLGGKASDTNRGGSLKTFVKEGQDQGSLAVKIKNAGTDAYRPEIYGASIIVERHFSRSGSSSFKIKNADAKMISTKKQEVDEITEWYALQIGNPLTVLSQDNARQFLNAATPAQKYKYFVSGVQLEQLDNDYKMSQDTLDRTLILREDLKDKIGSVKKEVDEAERLSETAQSNQGMREKARHHRNQLVWSQVVQEEKKLETRIASLEKRDADIKKLEEECGEMTNALAEIEEKLDRAKEARVSLESEQHVIGERKSAAEAILNDIKRKQAELQREERDAYTRLKILRMDISSCEKKIQDEENQLRESTGTARAEKDAKLAESRNLEKSLVTQMADLTQELSIIQDNVRDAQQTLKDAESLRDIKRKEILVAEVRLKDLEKNTGSILDGFDRDIVKLAQATAGDKGFECKPIGPLGVHIKLIKPEWSGLLEKILGDGLNAFVVRSKSDQTRLSSLIRQLNLKKQPPIYIAYGGQIDTSRQEPDSEFDTILRVLEFGDDVVRSQLIINNQIEKIILVKERIVAERIMVDNDGPPRNVAACVCFHDGRGKRGQGLRITNRAGTIGSSPVFPNGQRPRMQSDSGRQLALLKENQKQLALEFRELMREATQATNQLKRRTNELEAHTERAKELKNELRRTHADIERISTELDAFEGADDRLVTLREERQNKGVEEEQLGLQWGTLTLTKRELSEQADDAKKKVDTEKQEEEDHRNRIAKAEKKVGAYQSMRQIARDKKNFSFESLDIQRGEKRRGESKREEEVARLADFIRQAQELAPDRVHIPEGETYESIETKYKALSDRLIQRQEQQGGTDQEIFDRAAEARSRYEDVMKQLDDTDQTISFLKDAIIGRLQLWRTFQRQISARIRIQFNYLLSERGFRGKIHLDHEFKRVIIHIEPDKTRKSSAGRNTKTLSGGEKSFSSICMLLSVWEAIGSPIRCLDEFDVFMDNVNRAISTNMLVSTHETLFGTPTVPHK